MGEGEEMKRLFIVLMIFCFVGVALEEVDPLKQGLKQRFSPEWHNSAMWYRDDNVQWAVFPDGHIEAFRVGINAGAGEITGELLEKIKRNYDKKG